MMTKFLEQKTPYTGHELRPHWIAEQTAHFGDALVAFRGPCKVQTSEMVDLEDSRQGFFIAAKEMLHFIGESFSGNLELAISNQRLLIAGFAEILSAELGSRVLVERRGNDLYIERKKLSVSIVTATPVSTLLHFGVNIDASGAPVDAIGLNDLGLDAGLMGQKLLEHWRTEIESMRKARCKVSPR